MPIPQFHPISDCQPANNSEPGPDAFDAKYPMVDIGGPGCFGSGDMAILTQLAPIMGPAVSWLLTIVDPANVVISVFIFRELHVLRQDVEEETARNRRRINRIEGNKLSN